MLPDDRLRTALERWVAGHSRPSEAVLHIGKKDLSPIQILEEIRDRTPTGELLLKVIENAISHRLIDEVLATFEVASNPSLTR